MAPGGHVRLLPRVCPLTTSGRELKELVDETEGVAAWAKKSIFAERAAWNSALSQGRKSRPNARNARVPTLRNWSSQPSGGKASWILISPGDPEGSAKKGWRRHPFDHMVIHPCLTQIFHAVRCFSRIDKRGARFLYSSDGCLS